MLDLVKKLTARREYVRRRELDTPTGISLGWHVDSHLYGAAINEIERLHLDRCARQSKVDRYFAALMSMAAATGRSVDEFMPPLKSEDRAADD